MRSRLSPCPEKHVKGGRRLGLRVLPCQRCLRRGEAGDRHAVGRARHVVERHCLAKSDGGGVARSEEHTSELQSLMRISYAVFCLKKKTQHKQITTTNTRVM